jgi:hypothetical protein
VGRRLEAEVKTRSKNTWPARCDGSAGLPIRSGRAWMPVAALVLSVACVAGLGPAAASAERLLAAPAGGKSATVTVSGTQWGTSTCYFGATEGNVRFAPGDLQEAGLTTYRVYGGMSRWEWQDDDGVYGSPSIDAIKADPNVVNWAWWDAAMTTPPGGSDYWWSGEDNLWQGNAVTLFSGLKAAGTRTVLTIRNRDNNGNPAWSPNPPTTTADWNEWWEHVFATVYWLNVRNDYRVDDFEVHNEPNNRGQGFGGTQAGYFRMVQMTKDAINYIYRTYLPGRTYHVYAPVTTGGSDWPLAALQQVPESFDSVDIHNYSSDITGYTQQVHGWMNSTGHGDYPLWLSEWATYRGGYDKAAVGVKTVLANMIRGAKPDNDHIDGSHLFTFYDWDGFSGGFQNFEGLVDRTGARRLSFYAVRMGTRALTGCRPTYQSTASSDYLVAITTRDATGTYVLVANTAAHLSYTIDLDLSALATSGTGTLWQFDASHPDVVVGSPTLSHGHTIVTVPGTAAILLKY